MHPQARHRAQRLGHQGSAAGVGLAHLRGDGEIARQCLGGHVGDEGLGTEQHRLGQRQQPADERRRAAAPAGTEARRGVRLRQRRGDHRAVGQVGLVEGGGERAVEDQRFIDLVAQDPQVMRPGHGADGADVVAGEHRAGGVVRRIEKDHPRGRRHRARHVGGVEPEAAVLPQRHRHGDGAGGAHQAVVGGVAGVGHQHFVAGFHQRRQQQVQRALRARHPDELVGAHRAAAAGAVLGGQGLQHRRLAPAVGIAGAAGLQRPAAFRRAIDLQPVMDRAWYGLGLVLIQQKRFEEAVTALQRNTELQPMSPYGWYQLARVHVDRQEPEEARNIIRRLKGFEPKVAAQLERETGLRAAQPS
jgi:hypothetical protein